MSELSLNDRAVLAVVAEQPLHGFAIARELDRDAPLGSIWRVARPQVYRSVDRLLDRGLVELGPVEHGHGPDRRIVTATPAGRDAVAAWATRPVDRLRQVRSELLVKLVVCRRLRLDGVALLGRQEAVIAAIHRSLTEALAATDDDERRVALLWRHANAEAVQRFLTAARDWWGQSPAPDRHGRPSPGPP